MQVTEIRKLCMVTVVMIQIVSWVCATSRPIASNHVSFYPEIISTHDAYHSSNWPALKPNEKKEMEKRRRVGSKPHRLVRRNAMGVSHVKQSKFLPFLQAPTSLIMLITNLRVGDAIVPLNESHFVP
ncbi:hypothetical protein YC2023_012666 [Brassica napus]